MKPEFSQASKSFREANPHIFEKQEPGKTPCFERPPTKFEIKSERDEQDQFHEFLREHGTVVFRSRMDKATTLPVGTPDFLFALQGTPIAIEFKAPGKSLTKEQDEMMLRMTGNGWQCFVVNTAEEAQMVCREIFRLGKHPAWVKCPCCENFFCTIHRMHAHDCECPEIDDWTVDPYTEGGRPL